MTRRELTELLSRLEVFCDDRQNDDRVVRAVTLAQLRIVLYRLSTPEATHVSAVVEPGAGPGR